VQPYDAVDVHDPPGAALHHPARGRTAGVEHAAQVRLDHVAPILVGHACDQTVSRHPGVVDEDVGLPGLLDKTLRLIGVGDIRLDGTTAGCSGNFLRLVLP